VRTFELLFERHIRLRMLQFRMVDMRVLAPHVLSQFFATLLPTAFARRPGVCHDLRRQDHRDHAEREHKPHGNLLCCLVRQAREPGTGYGGRSADDLKQITVSTVVSMTLYALGIAKATSPQNGNGRARRRAILAPDGDTRPRQ
jgi:hypothetical protein